MSPEHQRLYQALLLAKERARDKLYLLIDRYGAESRKTRAMEIRYYQIQADLASLERGRLPKTS